MFDAQVKCALSLKLNLNENKKGWVVHISVQPLFYNSKQVKLVINPSKPQTDTFGYASSVLAIWS